MPDVPQCHRCHRQPAHVGGTARDREMYIWQRSARVSCGGVHVCIYSSCFGFNEAKHLGGFVAANVIRHLGPGDTFERHLRTGLRVVNFFLFLFFWCGCMVRFRIRGKVFTLLQTVQLEALHFCCSVSGLVILPTHCSLC